MKQQVVDCDTCSPIDILDNVIFPVTNNQWTAHTKAAGTPGLRVHAPLRHVPADSRKEVSPGFKDVTVNSVEARSPLLSNLFQSLTLF